MDEPLPLKSLQYPQVSAKNKPVVSPESDLTGNINKKFDEPTGLSASPKDAINAKRLEFKTTENLEAAAGTFCYSSPRGSIMQIETVTRITLPRN